MSFVCPDCLTPGSLEITLSMQLPSDSRSDDIALQIVECSNCRFQGVAAYEESRRGALDSESWDHTGFRVAIDDVKALIETIQSCPRPSDEGCPCPVHRTLSRKNASGRWCGLDDVKVLGSFPMKWAK